MIKSEYLLRPMIFEVSGQSDTKCKASYITITCLQNLVNAFRRVWSITWKIYQFRGLWNEHMPCLVRMGDVNPASIFSILAQQSADINMGLVSKHPPKRPMHQSNTSTLLERLDARRLPGIMIPEFQALFTRCECGLITMRRAFNMHRCRMEPKVIDLTGDNE
jgi:hypothetical protein